MLKKRQLSLFLVFILHLGHSFAGCEGLAELVISQLHEPASSRYALGVLRSYDGKSDLNLVLEINVKNSAKRELLDRFSRHFPGSNWVVVVKKASPPNWSTLQFEIKLTKELGGARPLESFFKSMGEDIQAFKAYGSTAVRVSPRKREDFFIRNLLVSDLVTEREFEKQFFSLPIAIATKEGFQFRIGREGGERPLYLEFRFPNGGFVSDSPPLKFEVNSITPWGNQQWEIKPRKRVYFEVEGERREVHRFIISATSVRPVIMVFYYVIKGSETVSSKRVTIPIQMAENMLMYLYRGTVENSPENPPQ